MKEKDVINLDKMITDAKELAEEKSAKAKMLKNLKNNDTPNSIVASEIKKMQTESEQYKQLGQWLDELKQYRAIGTIEEFTTLKECNVKERNKPQKNTTILDKLLDDAGCNENNSLESVAEDVEQDNYLTR